VGRGRAGPSGKPCSTPSCLVSIPSEVGRGRHSASSRSSTTAPSVSFQSPRRWGGVDIQHMQKALEQMKFRFNPLGGGAGSPASGRALVGGALRFRFNPLGGAAGSLTAVIALGDVPAQRFRFNPLGGGAGSFYGRILIPPIVVEISFQSPRRWGGVGNGKRYHEHWLHNVSFQSPRRWGGVGLSLFANACRPTLVSFQSPRRWGAVGKAVAMDMSPA